jgi:hypothetical protein
MLTKSSQHCILLVLVAIDSTTTMCIDGVTIYVAAPLVTLTTTIIFFYALLCPTGPTMKHIGLITVTPAAEGFQYQGMQIPDGPRIWMGLLGENSRWGFGTVDLHIPGSCARLNRDSPTICTGARFNPVYGKGLLIPVESGSNHTSLDFSVLPRRAPTYVLDSPPAFLKGLGFVSISLFVVLTAGVFWMGIRYLSATLKKAEEALIKIPVLGWTAAIAITTG